MRVLFGSVSVLYKDEYLTCPVYAVGDDALKMYFDGLNTDMAIQQKLFEAWDTYTGFTKSKKETPEHTDGDVWRRLDVTRIGRFSTNLQNVVFAAKIATPIRYLFECGIQVDERTGVPLHTMLESGSVNVGKQGYSCFMLENNTTDSVEIANGGIYGCYKTEFGVITDVQITTSMMRLSLSLAGDDILSAYTENDIAGMFKKLQYKAGGGWGGNTQTKVRTGLAKYAPEYLGFEYEQKKVYSEENFGDEYLLYDDIDSVISAHPNKNYRWIHNRRYEIVTPENFEEILKEFYVYEGVIAIDTETTGLKITYRSCQGADDQLVGICLSKEVGTGYYFPLQMTKITNLCGGDHKYFMEAYMRKFLTVRKFVTHNVQFDWKVFYIYGINLNVVFDTMIAFALTEHAQSAGFEIGLKSLALRVLGLEMFDLDDFVKNGDWSKSGMHFSDLPFELCRRYAPTDADMTLALYYYVTQSKLLERYGAEYIFQVEIQFAKAAAYSEFYGYPVNLETLPKLSADLKSEVADIYKKMVDIVGYEFNPRSTPQVVKIMYDELKYPVIEGTRSTKKDILKELRDRTDYNDEQLYPLAGLLLTYRQLSGVISSFIDNKDKFINSDGIIHPSINALGARTGRVSIKDPNYQSYNDTVKKNIVPRNGYKMWDSDFSQIEYRVLASMSKEKFLMDAFADWDMDYHTLQASRMFGVPYAAAVGPIRQQAKRVNFALPYGMGDEELGRQIFGARNKENTKKAAKLRDLYFEGQDNVRRFFDVVRDNGVKNGYTTTLFGRKRFYPKGSASVQKIRRQAGNAVIQGTAADIYKIAVVRVFQMICAKGWLGKVLLDGFIHDEILGEVSNEINFDEFIASWREAFEVPVDGFCKLYAGFGIGNSWYMAKKQDLHPMFIQELIDTASERTWTGDSDKYINEVIVEGFEKHRIRRVREYLQTVSKGEIINPVMSSLLEETTAAWIMDCVKKDRAGTRQAMSAVLGWEVEDKTLDNKKKPCGIKKIGDWIKAYCYWQGLDASQIDLRDATETEMPKNGNETENLSVSDVTVDMSEMSETEFVETGISAFGFHILRDKLYVDLSVFTRENAEFFVKNYCETSGSYLLCIAQLRENEPMQVSETQYYVSGSKMVQMQNYIKALKSNRQVM